jgi:hypothetical protein
MHHWKEYQAKQACLVQLHAILWILPGGAGARHVIDIDQCLFDFGLKIIFLQTTLVLNVGYNW